VIVTPFAKTTKRVTEETASKRNSMMIDLADDLFVAYAQPGGLIENLVIKHLKNGKKITTFDVPENEGLIKAGAKKALVE
jgi:hypothetical protein